MTHHAAGGHAGPGAWLAVAVLVLLLVPYLGAARTLGTATGRPWRRSRTLAWSAGSVLVAAGVAATTVAAGARGHLVQHVLVGMAAPLALVLGAPVTLALAALPVPGRRRVTAVLRSRPLHALTHPVTAGALHTGGLWALYLTPLYALTTEHAALHAAVLVHTLLAGCLFAWSLAGPERAGRSPGVGIRLAVLVVASAAHGYLAKLLYARAPLLPPGSAHGAGELRDAAVWMYYAGDVAEIALAVAVLAGWYRRTARRPLGRATVTAPSP